MKQKRILVTGAAGFIGSNLCSHLSYNSENYVIGLDNFFSGSPDNLKHLKTRPNFEFINWDIRNPISLRVDEIYNLACPASPKWYQKDPVFTFETCVIGAMNMLKLAKECNAKILQASTSEVYGDPLINKQDEKYWGNVNPIGKRSCYDEGKRAAETLFMDYYRQYDVDIRIIRLFNTYGQNMDIDDGRVVSNFICQALENKPITIYGDGTQTRSFQYILDALQKIILVMNLDSTEERNHYPFNVGNPAEELTISKLADTIKKLCKSSSEIVFEELPEDDPKQRNPDISKLESAIDGSETSLIYTSLETGLKYTINYFKRFNNNMSFWHS